MTVNAEKTQETIISFPTEPVAPLPVTINNTAIERTETFKLLGVVLSNKLDWPDHCEYLHTKGSQRLYLLVYCSGGLVCLIMTSCRLHQHDPLGAGILCLCMAHLPVTGAVRETLRVVYPDLSYRRALSLTGMRILDQRREDTARGFSVQLLQRTTNWATCCPQPMTLGTISNPCPNIPG